MPRKGRCGRKKIYCALGERKNYSFNCYPLEYQKLKIEHEKLKRERCKYYIRKEDLNETIE